MSRDGNDRRDGSERTAEQRAYDGPELPDEVTAKGLDLGVRRSLHGLPEKLAERVARHLVMAGLVVGDDPELAYQHALAARQRAARVATVREACGETAYAAGKYAEALAELRAAKRMNGAASYVPMMADCERALGRPERALELDTPKTRERLDTSGTAELAIVVAGARRDLGQPEAARRLLEREQLSSNSRELWVARLRYAYADVLLELGQRDEAIEWFHRTVAVDGNEDTDAVDRLSELE